MSNIAVIGTGYVGLVTGVCLSDFGHHVVCVDSDPKKIEKLNNGETPIYEPGLLPIVERNRYYGRIKFTTDTREAVKNCDIVFIAVGTPPAEDGSADLKHVEDAAREIARAMNGYKVVVDKSTVPIGTGQKVKGWISEELKNRNVDHPFDVVSNPEFLREGSAVQDFTHPDRVVVGAESERAISMMKDVYRVLYLNETPFVETNLETAEMIKYASNAFLAMKITFINEIANLCEKVGANVQDVARAMGKDGRISPKFLHAGPGYGGSCFPKDTKALADIGKKLEARLYLVEQSIESNEKQKRLMAEKVAATMGDLKGKRIAVLGLAFKPNTDDMRESPAITIMNDLAARGAHFSAYDPKAIGEAKWRLENMKEHITYCSDEYAAIEGADAVMILTEWNQFRSLDLDRVKKSMKGNHFFDFRNIYRRSEMEERGFVYCGVGV
ncbi:MAG TPA: UDP-glucose/GDP-mannose dehydrogenase family protein [bacterium]|jgi:UDPglucose 6-dehydrogenase|nr:UDP-glucose/GDP-mannose dehydrogenase family protein [Myxococcales bacterium]HQC50715.1 UDP-glucose/GDP-mannose dehydrogenase family protein [bacterium]HQG13871.1 UDP-glucose/GDP-mannose dehydrogenase family protein [bacterium]HQH80481.1 UDP-glucose/GDP-mannose dehydrogenase family protein [bacterium]